MHIKLEINAESVEEFDAAVARFAPRATLVIGNVGEVTLPARESTAAEAETPLDPPTTKTRQRKPKDEPATGAASQQESTGSSNDQSATSTTQTESQPLEPDEHPLLVSKTLADVKALGNKKVSELGAGPIQQLLVESFGVRNFGSLDAADLDRAYAALDALK